MDKPLKLGAGHLYFGDSPIPIGRAEGLEIEPMSFDLPRTDVDKLSEAYKKLVKSTVQLKLTGFEYTLPNLYKLGLISRVLFRTWTIRERQRKGKKVFYSHRRSRSMKGK